MNANVIDLEEKKGLSASKTLKTRAQTPTILIVHEDEARRQIVEKLFQNSKLLNPYQILSASSLEEVRDICSRFNSIHLIFWGDPIWDDTDPQSVNVVLEIVERAQLHSRIPIFSFSFSHVFGDEGFAKELEEWFQKEGENTLKKAMEDFREESKPVRVLKEIDDSQTAGLVGTSPAMRGYLSSLQNAAQSEYPVLIEGETGSGKSEGARWIHRYRQMFLDQKGPLIEVSMAAIPNSLAESELFGHEKGAFTGATERKLGYFESAQGGTLFLDEIGDCPLDLQLKLLKVIDEKRFTRLGSSKPRRFDAKIIFATHRNLKDMKCQGTFREDLYYRICTIQIKCPSLDERKEDIPEIVRRILPEISLESGRRVNFDDLPKDFIQHLMSHPVEGNLRGVRQKLIRLITFAPKDWDGTLRLKDWRQNPALSAESESSEHPNLTYSQWLQTPWDPFDSSFRGLKHALEEVKERLIRSAMDQCNQDTTKAAELLKIPRSTLYGHLNHLDRDNA